MPAKDIPAAGSHEVAGVQCGQFGRLVRGEAEPFEAAPPALVHLAFQLPHPQVTAADRLGCPVSGGQHDQRVEHVGPLYPIGALVSFAGMVVLTVAAIRARVLPWWTAPLLTITWIVGGVVGDDGPLGFKGSALLLAAAGIAVAAATTRPTASN
jgi:hypothetical protein